MLLHLHNIAGLYFTDQKLILMTQSKMKDNVIIQLYSLGILIVKVLSLYHIYIYSNGEVFSLIYLVNLECLSK